MENLLAVILIIDIYVVIYYRLMVRHHYEKQFNIRETNFAAIFSLPPYSKLSEDGKKFSKRYWYALSVMLLCIAILASTRNIGYLAG